MALRQALLPAQFEDDVIAGSMLTFAENVIASGLADSWFYIRYSDPDAHIRLRFRGSPERLTGQLFGHICDWAGRLITDGLCLKFVFDTYEREVERFGGLAGMSAAEALFKVDSRYVVELLHSTKTKQWLQDHKTLVAISIDDLLGGIGFTEEARLRWYRSSGEVGWNRRRFRISRAQDHAALTAGKAGSPRERAWRGRDRGPLPGEAIGAGPGLGSIGPAREPR